MSDGRLAARGRFPRFPGLEKLCQISGQKLGQYLARLLRGRPIVPVDELDDWLKRDIGIDATMPRDRRTEHYRKMLKAGQPLA